MTLEDFQKKKLALCVDAGAYEGVSLFSMKIYEYLPEPASEKQGFLRVIDEDGESYYYDANAFLKVETRRDGLSIPFARSNGSSRKSVSARAHSR